MSIKPRRPSQNVPSIAVTIAVNITLKTVRSVRKNWPGELARAAEARAFEREAERDADADRDEADRVSAMIVSSPARPRTRRRTRRA